MLKNKSILLPKQNTDGIRVCVMNSIHPEYEFDIWLPSLSPSRELIESYVINKTIAWPEFKIKYELEQKNRKNNSHVLLALVDLIKNATAANTNVTLLCSEETPFHCHRQIILEQLLKLDPTLPH